MTTPSKGAPMGASGNLEAREISINGRYLRCQVCEFTRFYRREARVTTGASFFGQDWANTQAECLVCEQCGYVHWFMRSRTAGAAIEDAALSEEIEELRRRLEADYEASLESSRS